MSSSSTPPGSDENDESIPVYLLKSLTEKEKESFMNEFAKEAGFGGLGEPYFIEWSPADNQGKTSGDLDDMYRIWKSKEDTGAFLFFIDEDSVSSMSVIIAQPEMYIMMHTKEAGEWALGLMDTELKKAFEQAAARELEEAVREGTRDDETTYEMATSWAGELLEVFEEEIVGRGLTYGRITASGLAPTHCNLAISNMSMFECVEFHKIEGEGIVRWVWNKEWDEKEFAEKYCEEVREAIKTVMEPE